MSSSCSRCFPSFSLRSREYSGSLRWVTHLLFIPSSSPWPNQTQASHAPNWIPVLHFTSQVALFLFFPSLEPALLSHPCSLFSLNTPPPFNLLCLQEASRDPFLSVSLTLLPICPSFSSALWSSTLEATLLLLAQTQQGIFQRRLPQPPRQVPPRDQGLQPHRGPRFLPCVFPGGPRQASLSTMTISLEIDN